ncbi:hypothetical protein HOK51_01870 [Candidatus Woesearchaeota archaeon]|jgi:hypothetical protein|nr:hypothetical protein [Candidatus Woesearchaeota archaeon]MBT7366905.1 hypothetical protein [Candidatus Woesearchaeota archaeon]
MKKTRKERLEEIVKYNNTREVTTFEKIRAVSAIIVLIGAIIYWPIKGCYNEKTELKKIYDQCQQIDKTNPQEYEKIRESPQGKYSCKEIDQKYTAFFE